MCLNLAGGTDAAIPNMSVDQDFSRRLLRWYHLEKRDLPWRGISDPYHIWVSEIMLQQTRVDQAMPYYHRFTAAFPDIESLAKADRHDVLRLWEGLGYYSRARNMQDAARQIMESFNGKFPESYDDIIRLKGIGPYTAAAISSIAFGGPHAVVDGNVIRVMSRYAGIADDVRKSDVLKRINALAQELLDAENPGDHNQAVMELGATVCTPSNPDCLHCPVNDGCTAFMTANTDAIPYKSPAKKTPHHQIVVAVCVDDENRVLIAQRPEDKMLGGLWEFPGGKVEKGEQLEAALHREIREELGVGIETGEKVAGIKHTYSHFKITLHAWLCRITENEPQPKAGKQLKWVSATELDAFPFPKANRKLTQALQSLL